MMVTGILTISFAYLYSSCESFTTNPGSFQISQQKTSTTELYIIGPILRRMREEKAKNQMPMASDTEKVNEAPGLRVGSNAWKWPPVWPYAPYDFTPKEDIEEPKGINPVGILSGNLPSVDDLEQENENETFDALKYWGEEKASEFTEIDDEAVSSLKK